jgi:alkylation response protein AidB-like acyl-CoA dehydrogenase
VLRPPDSVSIVTTVEHRSLAHLRGAVRALAAEWLAAGRYEPRCDAWMRSSDRDFTRELAARGWIGMTWPTDLGGGGRPAVERLVVTEELLRAGAPVAAHWIADRQIGPAILRYGSRELQEEFLPRIASGEITFCLCMSETEAGSDLAAVRTRARRVDDGWRVSGAKIWTSHAHEAEYGYVLTRSDASGSKHAGLTELVVDMRSEGIEVRPIRNLEGEHHFNEVFFDDVAVPERWTLGEPGRGWEQATAQLAFERGGPERLLSTYPLLVTLIEWASERDDPSATRAAGELVARLRALRQLAYDVAVTVDAGEAPAARAAMLKHAGTAFEQDLAEHVRRLTGIEPEPGGEGMPGLLAQAILAGPGFTIRGGSSDVLLGIVARAEAPR